MPTVTVKLKPEEFQSLEEEAKRRGATKSSILRDALNRVVRGEAEGSIAQKIQDLIGSAEGPEDLATNPKHIEDYGKGRSR